MKLLNLNQVKSVSGGTKQKSCVAEGVTYKDGEITKNGFGDSFMCNDGKWEQVPTPPPSQPSSKS